MAGSLPSAASLFSERFPCPHKGCRAVLRSKVSHEIHSKYFHKVSVGPPEGDGKTAGSKRYNASRKECSRPYYCEEKECTNKSGRKNSFKCYAALKQHYMNFHAKKMFSCKKCGRMFSEDAKKTRHEFDCSISFVCSCGIAFSKKSGLVLHVKRTRHTIPQGVEEYLFQKPERKHLGKIVERKRQQPVASVIPKGAFRTPSLTFKKKGATPILPKVFPLKFDNNPSLSVVTPNSEVPSTGLGLNRLIKSRVVIDIYHPPESSKKQPLSECSARKSIVKHGKKPPPVLAPRNMDSLSVAMVKSGIAPSNESPGIPVSGGVDIQSKTSQTDWTVISQPAQDFSCQTDEFLAWLDSESARCFSGESESGNTLHVNGLKKPASYHFDISDGNSHGLSHTNVRNVVQHETQTDDDWLSALLHETEPISNEVSDAESQTNAVNFGNLGVNCNANANNNNTYSSVLQDAGCDIQTQTPFMDSVADVTTQTASMFDMGIDNTSSLFFNLASNIQTQTEVESSLVSTAHTQTTWQDDGDFTEFFNMETQTDSFAPNVTQLTAAQTQTWRES